MAHRACCRRWPRPAPWDAGRGSLAVHPTNRVVSQKTMLLDARRRLRHTLTLAKHTTRARTLSGPRKISSRHRSHHQPFPLGSTSSVAVGTAPAVDPYLINDRITRVYNGKKKGLRSTGQRRKTCRPGRWSSVAANSVRWPHRRIHTRSRKLFQLKPHTEEESRSTHSSLLIITSPLAGFFYLGAPCSPAACGCGLASEGRIRPGRH